MKKILIVEDELPIAELEKDYLELSGFEVVIETDLSQASRFYRDPCHYGFCKKRGY